MHYDRGRLSALRNSRTTLPRAKPISKLVDCLDMVFLLQVEGAEKTLTLAGSGFPAGLRKELLSTEADRPCYQKLYGLGLDQHGGLCCSISDPSCMGHVADNVSRSRAHHRSGGESVKVKQGSGCRMQRAESEGGRARLVETLSKVSPAVSGRGVK